MDRLLCCSCLIACDYKSHQSKHMHQMHTWETRNQPHTRWSAIHTKACVRMLGLHCWSLEWQSLVDEHLKLTSRATPPSLNSRKFLSTIRCWASVSLLQEDPSFMAWKASYTGLLWDRRKLTATTSGCTASTASRSSLLSFTACTRIRQAWSQHMDAAQPNAAGDDSLSACDDDLWDHLPDILIRKRHLRAMTFDAFLMAAHQKLILPKVPSRYFTAALGERRSHQQQLQYILN